MNHLTLFALFVRDWTTLDTPAAGFPKILPETGALPFGSGGRGLVVAGVAMLALVASAWLARRR